MNYFYISSFITNAKKNKVPSFLGLFTDVLLCGIFMISFPLLSAIIITLGFISWCSDITERFPSCDMAAGQNITENKENINTTGFYFEIVTSQVFYNLIQIFIASCSLIQYITKLASILYFIKISFCNF